MCIGVIRRSETRMSEIVGINPVNRLTASAQEKYCFIERRGCTRKIGYLC
jgi:hypothetical protein